MKSTRRAIRVTSMNALMKLYCTVPDDTYCSHTLTPTGAAACRTASARQHTADEALLAEPPARSGRRGRRRRRWQAVLRREGRTAAVPALLPRAPLRRLLGAGVLPPLLHQHATVSQRGGGSARRAPAQAGGLLLGTPLLQTGPLRRPVRVHVRPAAAVQRRPRPRVPPDLGLHRRVQGRGQRRVRPGHHGRRRERVAAGERGLRHRPIHARPDLPRPDAAARVPHARPRGGRRGVRPVLRRARLGDAPREQRPRGAGRPVSGRGGLAGAAARVARHGRARPLPGVRAGYVGLHRQPRRRRLGQRAHDLPGHPQRHVPHHRGQPMARQRLRRAVSVALPPVVRRRGHRLAGPRVRDRPPVSLGLRRRGPRRQPAHGARPDHGAVRQVEPVRAAGRAGAGALRAGPRHAAAGERRVLRAAARRRVHAQVHLRHHPRRLHPGLLPPRLRLPPVHLAPAEGPPELLGVHPARRRGRAERQHRGGAEQDTAGEGGADAGAGHPAHPHRAVPAPGGQGRDVQGRVRRRPRARHRPGGQAPARGRRGTGARGQHRREI
ncbi:hypothetical protein ACQJBY_020512 [Aegilops geniculata]